MASKLPLWKVKPLRGNHYMLSYYSFFYTKEKTWFYFQTSESSSSTEWVVVWILFTELKDVSLFIKNS